jgi:hypothetical protein
MKTNAAAVPVPYAPHRRTCQKPAPHRPPARAPYARRTVTVARHVRNAPRVPTFVLPAGVIDSISTRSSVLVRHAIRVNAVTRMIRAAELMAVGVRRPPFQELILVILPHTSVTIPTLTVIRRQGAMSLSAARRRRRVQLSRAPPVRINCATQAAILTRTIKSAWLIPFTVPGSPVIPRNAAITNSSASRRSISVAITADPSVMYTHP